MYDNQNRLFSLALLKVNQAIHLYKLNSQPLFSSAFCTVCHGLMSKLQFGRSPSAEHCPVFYIFVPAFSQCHKSDQTMEIKSANVIALFALFDTLCRGLFRNSYVKLPIYYYRTRGFCRFVLFQSTHFRH
jgi:hypothetical protein